jgi:hypothetical protein
VRGSCNDHDGNGASVRHARQQPRVFFSGSPEHVAPQRCAHVYVCCTLQIDAFSVKAAEHFGGFVHVHLDASSCYCHFQNRIQAATCTQQYLSILLNCALIVIRFTVLSTQHTCHNLAQDYRRPLPQRWGGAALGQSIHGPAPRPGAGLRETKAVEKVEPRLGFGTRPSDNSCGLFLLSPAHSFSVSHSMAIWLQSCAL